MGLFNKKELRKIEELETELINQKKHIEELGLTEYIDLSAEIDKKQKVKEELNNELSELEDTINQKKKDLILLTSDIDVQDFGLYRPTYKCMTSSEYADLINNIREKQKKMIKDKKALNYYDGWVLEGSKSKGAAMNNDNMKMVLRAFNYECETLITNVKFNNFDKVKERIIKSADAIDKLNKRNRISITQPYITLKIDELHAVHEYNVKKQEEKEAMRAAREEEREAAKLQKEIEEARKNITKDINHYEKVKLELENRLSNASVEEKAMIEEKLNEIKEQLSLLNSKMKDVDYREANQKAGYVYVISNIGAFGEGVYKIGMTRRLDPQDRVDELGDASVPFTFDVHAMIFSDDAPKLEAALHKAFSDRRVNKINMRKEFFKVSLEEIEKVVKENHDKLIEFNKVANAEQYRETLKISELSNN